MATTKDTAEAERGVKRDRLQARLDAIVASRAAAYRREPPSAPIGAETVAAELEPDQPSTE
jgi:hypothetical protein